MTVNSKAEISTVASILYLPLNVFSALIQDKYNKKTNYNCSWIPDFHSYFCPTNYFILLENQTKKTQHFCNTYFSCCSQVRTRKITNTFTATTKQKNHQCLLHTPDLMSQQSGTVCSVMLGYTSTPVPCIQSLLLISKEICTLWLAGNTVLTSANNV